MGKERPCKRCGKLGLHWEKFALPTGKYGFRLFNADGSMHGYEECKAWKKDHPGGWGYDQYGSDPAPSVPSVTAQQIVEGAGVLHMSDVQLQEMQEALGMFSKSVKEGLTNAIAEMAVSTKKLADGIVEAAPLVVLDSIINDFQFDGEHLGTAIAALKETKNWKDDPEADWLCKAIVAGKVKRAEVAPLLGITEKALEWRVWEWKKAHGLTKPKAGGKQNPAQAITDTPPSEDPVYEGSYAGLKDISWTSFLGTDTDNVSRWDLRRICATTYASERLMNAPQDIIARAGLNVLRGESFAYVAKWAERFAKYGLAASLGEFRHRKQAGPMKLVPVAHSTQHRAACQGVAFLLWPDREKTVKAARYMGEKFANFSYFSGNTYGGERWSKISRTIADWLEGRVSDIAFVDYSWDLSHNGGSYFNKCDLFYNEQEARVLLNAKAASKSKTGDVRAWAGKYLRPEMLAALDALEPLLAKSVTQGQAKAMSPSEWHKLGGES